jgi:hypothetical protein
MHMAEGFQVFQNCLKDRETFPVNEDLNRFPGFDYFKAQHFAPLIAILALQVLIVASRWFTSVMLNAVGPKNRSIRLCSCKHPVKDVLREVSAYTGC